MKNLVLFIVCILVLVFVQFAQAQSVDQIIEKHLAARGGKEFLRTIKSVTMEGVKNAGTTEYNFKMIQVQNLLYRSEIEWAGHTGYTIITPDKGWTFTFRKSTKPDELTNEQLKKQQVEMDIAGPLVDYAVKGHKVEAMGEDMVYEKKAHKLKVTLVNGNVVYYFIDPKTYMVLQTRTIVDDATQGKVEQVTDFSDYRTVENFKFPFSVNVQGGPATGVTTFSMISLNREIGDELFKP